MTTERRVDVSLNEDGDLVWAGQDLGPGVGILIKGATEYEFWRTVPAAHIPALVAALGGQPGDDATRLVRERFDSDVALKEFADAHGIPTRFSNWISSNWDE